MLLSYEPTPYQALNADGWGYTLKIREVKWWGLVDRIVTIEVQVPLHTDTAAFYEPKLNVWNYGR